MNWAAPSFAAIEPLHTLEPCELRLNNDRCVNIQLVDFQPETQTLVLQQGEPPHNQLSLPFAHFRSLKLLNPLRLKTAAQLPLEPERYRVVTPSGPDLTGLTLDIEETTYGLFLFPPGDQPGTLTSLFVPRARYLRVEIGHSLSVLSAEPPVEPAGPAVPQTPPLPRQRESAPPDSITTPERLLAALERQSKMPVMRIGEALLVLGMIDKDQLVGALAQQQDKPDKPLGALLIEQGWVSQEDLRTALKHKMGYPLVDVEVFPVDAEALRLVPYMTAVRLEALPLLAHDGQLVVALQDPSRHQVLDELEFVSQRKVLPALALPQTLVDAIHHNYEQVGLDHWSGQAGARPLQAQPLEPHETGRLVEALERDSAGGLADGEDRPIEQSDNSLVRLLNNMILEAHERGVSDIHIECNPGRQKVRVRFRRDGLLQPYLELPHNYRSALVARLKIMCDLDISERRNPQDGKINFAKFVPGHRLELRVATVPTHDGLEDVVLRLLSSARPLPLDQLGLSEHNLERLREAAERPYGMVLCVGPTGSGKTTTLHSVLGHLNTPARKIWTAEDPVEITQPGLRQVQVNPKTGLTFAKALRSFLRADPDVIMVGEIRDRETAHIAVEASLTGHLVLSTLHTNSAPETVTRLLDMGVDPFNFADSLLAVLGQRLVHRLCPHCRRSREAEPAEVDELLADWLRACPKDDKLFKPALLRREWLQRFGVDGRILRYESPGCERCDHTGFLGRAGLHELLLISRELRHLIQTGARSDELLKQALREGMRTLRQDGIEKVLQGITSLAEVRATSNV